MKNNFIGKEIQNRVYVIFSQFLNLSLGASEKRKVYSYKTDFVITQNNILCYTLSQFRYRSGSKSSNCAAILRCFLSLFFSFVFTDSEDKDQTAQNVQSDLGLHCPILFRTHRIGTLWDCEDFVIKYVCEELELILLSVSN